MGLQSQQAIEVHLRPELIVVWRTPDAMQSHGLLSDYPHIQRSSYGREGGLMKLVARVVDSDPLRTLDAVMYLMDPVDPSSAFPEAVVLKRQCIIHGKPFLSTLASAREWLELEACALGAPPEATLDATFDPANESVALIAHDAMKEKMLELAERHFDLLNSFVMRCATGTTGGLLTRWQKGSRASKPAGTGSGHF